MKRLFAFVSILLLVSATLAQDVTAPAVPLKAVWSRSAIPMGEGATLGVVFDVPAKHHITDVAFGLFTVTVNDTLGLDFSEPIFPQGVTLKEDEVCYRGRVVVSLPVAATDSAKPGTYKIPVAVAYQMCQEFGNEVCFMPEEKTIELTATIVPAGTAVTAANAEVFAPPPAGTQAMSLDERLTAALNKGSWLAFLLVFVGGILAELHALRLPCDSDHHRLYWRGEPQQVARAGTGFDLRARDRADLQHARPHLGGDRQSLRFDFRLAAGDLWRGADLRRDGRQHAGRV